LQIREVGFPPSTATFYVTKSSTAAAERQGSEAWGTSPNLLLYEDLNLVFSKSAKNGINGVKCSDKIVRKNWFPPGRLPEHI